MKKKNEFGLNLRDARQRAGLSQWDLARRSGLQPAAISHLECGRREPRWRTFCSIVKVLSFHGITANDLMTYENCKGKGI